MTSLVVLGAMTGSPVSGLQGLGLTGGATVTTSFLSSFGYHPNRISGARYRRDVRMSFDGLRGNAAARAYFQMLDLMVQQESARVFPPSWPRCCAG